MPLSSFEFATDGRIVFGCGKISLLPSLVKPLCKKVMLVTGAHPLRYALLREQLEKEGLSVAVESIAHEPTVQRVSEVTDSILRQQCDGVVGIGGGSVIDAAKAAAALANNPADIFDYLEVVGAGKPLPCASLPLVAVPTTAGTGAEVTKNAVLTVPEQQVKVSLRSPRMFPQIALVDPELTADCPPEVSISCGFDALCHLLEAYLSAKATPMSDAFCREGLSRLGGGVLMAHWLQPDHVSSRINMSLASLMGGLALANGGLGAVHGFAGVLGGCVGAPHGAICAALLAPVLKMNLKMARASQKNNPTLLRLSELSLMMTRDMNSSPEDLSQTLERMAKELQIPKLEKLGLKKADFPSVIDKSLRSSSMKGNPFVLTPEQLGEILEEAF